MKDFLYVGYYFDQNGTFILKIGTTNDLKRRKTEHNYKYRRAKTHTMPQENSFEYLWTLPLSKYNTLRYEDKNRQKWQDENVGRFIRNDRFVCDNIPNNVIIKIRKEYIVEVAQKVT